MDQVIYGFPIAAITIGLVQVIKQAFVLEDRFAPLVSLIVAIILTVGLFASKGELDADAVLAGIVFGLSASGLYSGVNTLKNG